MRSERWGNWAERLGCQWRRELQCVSSQTWVPPAIAVSFHPQKTAFLCVCTGMYTKDQYSGVDFKLYDKLNTGLRNSTHLFPIYESVMHCAIQNFPSTRQTVLFRGQPQSFGVKYEVGEMVTWQAFTSTSEDIKTTLAFGYAPNVSGLLFEIHGVHPKMGGLLQTVSYFSTESELLLRANAQFTVIARHEEGGSVRIELAALTGHSARDPVVCSEGRGLVQCLWLVLVSVCVSGARCGHGSGG